MQSHGDESELRRVLFVMFFNDPQKFASLIKQLERRVEAHNIQ